MNSKVILFTFRTFPAEILKSLEDINVEVFIFGKLKEDIERFKELAKQTDANHAIGFALSSTSRQELTSLNRFNKGKIDISAPSSRELKILYKSPFPVAKKETYSFCNYAMFALSGFIETSFFHVKEDDFTKLVSYFKSFYLPH
ncbi:hypothetical protein H6800_00475 [Candidatus Nomurabacteria bacterium]|mgnify:CR=1 FL=1|nr:hypothetical protein [Candidatus Nomurabacteria bacterium]